MRIIKWIFGLLFLAVALAVIVAAYIAMTFDANSYKDRIIKTVKAETGRDLTLNGELTTTFYPWLGMNMNDAGLSNADGFAAEQFMKIDEASIRLQLMPLLKKNIVADRIQLKGVEVWLERDAGGKANWDDIVERFSKDDQVQTEAAGAGITGTIAGVSLKNATLHWKDAKDKQDMSVLVKRFDTGELKPDAETTVDGEIHFDLKDPVIQGQAIVSGVTRLSATEPFILSQPKLSMDLQGVATQAENIHADIGVSEIRYEKGVIILSNPDIDYVIKNMPSLGENAKGNLKGSELRVNNGDISIPKAQVTLNLTGSALPGDSLTANVQTEKFSMINSEIVIQNLNANGIFKGAPWPNNELDGSATATSFKVNLDKDTMSAPAFSAKALGLDVSGSVNGRNITKESLALTGKINVAEFSPKVIAPKLDIELPEMSDEAWTRARFSGNYKASKNSVALTNLDAMIDGTDWKGKAAVDDLNNKKVSFDLSAVSLNANFLMPPEQADALTDKEGKAESAAKVNAIEIPSEPLRIWDAKGTLRLGKLTVGNIVTTNLEAGIDLLDGKLRVFPSKANFFGGQYSGDIRLDVSGATPRLQADEKITNINLDAMGKALWAESYMTGNTSGRITLDATGATIGMMRESAKGDVAFKVTDGVMQGFDLNYAVANAVSLVRSKSLSDVTDTKQTAFKNLSATANVNNGLLQNDDFLAVMPRMRIRGNGQLNLIDTGINYHVDADILESKSGSNSETELSLDELVGASIPIKITGTLAEPKIRPDVAGYLKSKVEREIRDRAQQEIEDKLKDKIGDELGGVLGGLLGGSSKSPEPETEPEPELSPTETSEKADGAVATESEEAQAPEEVAPTEPEPELDPIEQKKKDLEDEVKDKLKDLFGG